MNVLKEIFDWSSDRPAWQRDALRRLVSHGELKETDIAELAQLCKASHGLAGKAKGEPLAAVHLPPGDDNYAPVTLVSLTHHSGVNALAADQTIAFGPQLTVVYGANAAGKSGYTRILKRACRARGAEDILGNVVAGVMPGRPAATIKYRIDGTEREYRWDDGNPPHPDLSRVSVFDRHCASVYVAEQTDVAYRPLGLDLFDKLSDSCESVRRVLEVERKELDMAATHLPEVAEGTKVYDLLTHLTSLTKPEEVRALGSLSEEEIAELEGLRKRLRELRSDDPHKAARVNEIRLKRLEDFGAKIGVIGHILDDAAVAEIFSSRDRAWSASQAAEAMRREAFGTQPLRNTGSEAWRELWKAAERFSWEDAYPEELFPVTETDARCVLCQQHLQDEAVSRFMKFQDFLLSKVQQERQLATKAYEARKTTLMDLSILDSSMSEVLDELQLEEADLAAAIKHFLESAQHRRLAVMNALESKSGASSEPPALAAEPDKLPQYIECLRRRVAELRGSDWIATIRQIESELRELEARQILNKHMDAVLREIERKQRLAAYQVCLEDTTTSAITRKSTEVTKLAVTDQLARSFGEELDALEFSHVEVEMVAAGGRRGALYHKLQLRRAPNTSVPRVVSEGEARCLSLASFLAELSTAADCSAILFDDPVSSLDHYWRNSVAKRLLTLTP